jgi:hypothetical protein
LSPAVGSALNPETSSQLARSSALPAIVREQTAPAEQTGARTNRARAEAA